MFKLLEIKGDSLYPFYKNGEKVFCLKPFSLNKIDIDDIVIFNHEKEGLLIKQVTKIENNKYYVEGTTPYSLDSSVFGYLNEKEILYKVLFRF